MSWSIGANTDARDIVDALAENIDANPAAVAHSGPQLDVARRAAIDLAALVTRPGDRVLVIMQGHYNPDNEPAPGWADSWITVGVTQLPIATKP